MSAKWPSAVATDADLFLAVNLLQTTLSGTINNSVTTITLTSTTGFPTAGAVTIDNEVIFYTGVSGANLTGCVRGSDGTSAATHNTGVPVGATIVAYHHNGLVAEIEAIETDLHTRFGYGSSSIVFGVPIAGYQSWSVAGTALPASTGTVPSAGTILRMLGNSNAVFDFGSNSTTGAWLQSYDQSGMGTHYPILLNPRGGNVSVGADLTVATTAAVQATSAQLVLGATRTVTISAPTPATSSRTWTIPDQSGDMTFLSAEGTQTLTGTKTFVDGGFLLRGSDAAFSATIHTAAFAAARSVTLPDPGASASFVLTAGTQTIAGQTTLSAAAGNPIHGTNTNDSPSAGYIGEVIVGTGSAVNAATSGQYGDITTITLSAGDWMVQGHCMIDQNGATFTAPGIIAIGTAAGNDPSGSTLWDSLLYTNTPTGGANTKANNGVGPTRFSLSTSTVVRFKAQSNFTSGPPQYYGTLTAVRIR